MTRAITWKDAVEYLERYHNKKGFKNLDIDIDNFWMNPKTPKSFMIDRTEWNNALYFYGDVAQRKSSEIWKNFVDFGFVIASGDHYYLMIDVVREELGVKYSRVSRERELSKIKKDSAGIVKASDNESVEV